MWYNTGNVPILVVKNVPLDYPKLLVFEVQ